MQSYVHSVAIDGEYAYVAGTHSGLHVIRISDRSNPFEVGFLETGYAMDVVVNNGYAYLATLNEGVKVVRVTSPASPTLVTTLYTGYAYSVTQKGNQLYVGAGNTGLAIINIGSPTNPYITDIVDTPGTAVDVAINGNYALVADRFSNTMRIINVANPLNAYEVGYYQSLNYVTAVATNGTYAYVSSFGLKVIDISSPSSPQEIGSTGTFSSTDSKLLVNNNAAYITSRDEGLQIIDVSVPSAPLQQGSFSVSPNFPEGVAYSDNYLYVANETKGLQIFDVSNPGSPQAVGNFDTDYLARAVTIGGDYAYVADYFEMVVIDIQDPTNPRKVSAIPTSYATDIAVFSNYVYVADFNSGIRIIDVSNPNSPTEVHLFPSRASGVAASNNLVYFTTSYDQSLKILDVSDPYNPVQIGEFNIGDDAGEVRVIGDYAYVIGFNTGLHVINIANPAAMSRTDLIVFPASVKAIAVSGNFAYVGTGVWSTGSSNSIRVIDIGNPYDIQEVGYYFTSGQTDSLIVNDNVIYSANLWGGITISQFTAGEPTYSISGKVANIIDLPIAGVAVFADNGQFDITDNDGNYKIINLTSGAYDVSPTKPSHVFSPAVQPVTLPPSTQAYNFIGMLDHNFSIPYVEVSQAVQDLDNSVPLIEDKPAFVRVYVDCGVDCNSVPGVSGLLHGYGPNGELPQSPLIPNKAKITTYHEPVANQQANLQKTLNFTLPPEWTTGTITLTAQVETNSLTITKTFETAEPIRVIYVPIRYNGTQPTTEEMHYAMQWAKNVFPTDQLVVLPGTTLEWNKCLEPNTITCPKFLRDKHSLQLFDKLADRYDLLQNVYIFGWLPANSYGGGLARPDSTFPKVAFGDVNVDDKDHGQRIFAHEIAHLLGRGHSNTEAEKGDSNCREDPKLHLNGEWTSRFDDATIQEFGLDVVGNPFGWLVSSSDVIKNPANTYDYMSYCGRLSKNNVWTSPWTYTNIFTQNLQIQTEVNLNLLADQTQYLITSGLVYTDNTALINPAWIVNSTLPIDTTSTGSNYCVETQDATNIVLASNCFDLDFTNLETGMDEDLDGFYVALPYSIDVARIIVRKGALELASYTASQNKPTVEILSPNGGELWANGETQTISWMSHDLDNDDLTYRVQYSLDGENWNPIGGTTTNTQISVNVDELVGGTTARIRVLATDGFNTNSDESDGFFSIERKTPQIFISTPPRSGSTPIENQILLMGYGFDLEDGSLAGAVFEWHSNKDGFLGNGDYILASLSQGQHTITLQGRDSDLNYSTATVEIYIGNRIFLPAITNH